MKQLHTNYRLLTALLLTALVLRLAGVWLLRHQEPGPDAVIDYLPMAHNVLAGRGFLTLDDSPDFTRGPTYALFVAAIQLLAGPSLLALRIAQALVDTATVYLVLDLGGRLFSSKAGLWAGLIYALNPLAVWACALIGPEILFAFLMTLSVWFLVRALAVSRWQDFLWCGITLGVTVLCRATPLLLLFPWVAWVWWQRRSRQGLSWGMTLVLGCVLTVSIWTIRNALVFHEFIAVVANGGVNFYAGSSPAFEGPMEETSAQRLQRRQELLASGAVAPLDPEAGPSAGDRSQFQMGLANYRLAWQENKLAVLLFLARKCGRLWYATYSGRYQQPTLLINGLLLLGAVLGCILAWRQPETHAGIILLAGTVAYFVLVLTALLPLARYVMGFTPLLSTLAGLAPAALWQRASINAPAS